VLKGGTGIVPGGNVTNFLDPDVQTIRDQLDKSLSEAGQPASSIAVTRVDRDVVIRLADHLLFPSASAQLQPAAIPLLSVVAEVIRTLPNQVRVEGHTDDVPVATDRYPTNWELSSARATSVLRYLVEQARIAPERLVAAGYAEFQPVAPNRTPEGRALNRRADIVLVTPSPQETAVPTQPAPQAPVQGVPAPASPAVPDPSGGH
jgi:chemotaxis protein MotB